jgi:2-hydroxy-6-oxonona-2,4-dienedioate hydrolase
MIHGTGGGFDQGLAMSESLARRGYRIVAPSRFGYLRSDFPADPSSENQADALVALLDHLGIDRLAIAGGSAGALSAVQFALRHPDRCAALVLIVPAANVSGRDPVAMTPTQEFLVDNVLGSDFLFWSARKVAPRALIRNLLATDAELLDQVAPAERDRAFRILDGLLPVSRRARGLRNDAKLAGSVHQVAYRRIKVPTLIVALEDDRFGTAATARYLARTIPDAELVMLERGGHIWLGSDDILFNHVARFLRANGRKRHQRG